MRQNHVISILQTNMTTVQVVFADALRELGPMVGMPAPWATDYSPQAFDPRMPQQPRMPQAPTASRTPQGMQSTRMAPETLEYIARSARVYTYKALTEDNVKPGDKVILDSPSDGLTVAMVVEVHQSPRIDLDAQFDYKWIVGKVDLARYHGQLEQEHAAGGVLLESERTAQKTKLMDAVRSQLSEVAGGESLLDKLSTMLSGKPALVTRDE